MDEHGPLLGWSVGPRLVDCWLVPQDGVFMAVVDGPDESSFEPLIASTAAAFDVPADQVELRPLAPAREAWPFRGAPAREDPTRREPRPTRWERIDVGADDRTHRVLYIHGIPNGLHHVELHEDDEEVRVTVYLGLNHDWAGVGTCSSGSVGGRR